MTEVGSALRGRLRQRLAPLLLTPLHPQWLVARQNRGRAAWVAQRAVGAVLDVGCAGSNIRTALAQGAIDALAARSWRLLWLPALPAVILLVNLAGWLGARLWPTRQLMLGAYYVEAARS